MTDKQQPKLYIHIVDLMRAALGVATIDGGFVIAVQIINFLSAYFGMRVPTGIEQMPSFAIFNQANILVLILGMLNLAVIIYRVAGLARGIKYSAVVCYQQAIRRWPSLILLYLLGSLIAMVGTLPALKLLSLFAINSPEQMQSILLFLLLALIPYGIFACIFVVDQEKSPTQAIIATWRLIRDQISARLLFNLSLLYGLPAAVGSVLAAKYFGQYIGLFNAVWFLFCHIVTIIIYTGTLIKASVKQEQKKFTTIVV
jgi:hypothetical protein